MHIDNPTFPTQADGSTPILAAKLTPHRSLSRNGFAMLMLVFGGVSFVAGVAFTLMGAWPVMGFFGLDVAILWWALRSNFRSAKIHEDITVTAHNVTIRRINGKALVSEVTLSTAWLQVETKSDPEDGMQSLAVRSHGRSYTIGGFLDPGSRESFAAALKSALAVARRPTVTDAASG